MFDERMSRRELMATLGTGAGISLSGCNGIGSSGDRTTTNQTATESTVVFTDSTTASGTTTTSSPDDRIVFNGGGIHAFADAVQTASWENSTLEIDPGTYRFNPVEQSGSGFNAHVEFQDLSGLTIEGNNSTLIFTDPGLGGMQFTLGSDITVRNLTLDYDPVPFTQGTITEFSRDSRTVTLELDSGFPSLNHQMFDAAATVYATTHQEDGGFVETARTDISPDKFFSKMEAVGDRTFRLHLEKGRSDFTGIETDHRLTIVARNRDTALLFYKVDNPTVENVTVRTSNGGAFISQACKSPSFINCTIAPPPDSNRQLASIADGVRITNCIDGATIDSV